MPPARVPATHDLAPGVHVVVGRRPMPLARVPAAVATLLWLSASAFPTPSAAEEPRLAAPHHHQDSAALRITFLDVGQADAIVIQAPEGRTALVDAGRRSPVNAIRALGVEEIDLVVATHAHADHIGGMADVLRAFPVRYFMDNALAHTTRTYRRLMDEVERRSDIVYLLAEPRTIALGAASIEVLPLPPPGPARDQNNRSVTLIVRHGRFSALLSGDSEIRQLNFLVARGAVPPVTVLKAPHHGSHTGFTPAFVQAARPEVVVISVGRNNQYGHPRPQALTAFSSSALSSGARPLYRTDRDGTITVLGFPDGAHRVLLGDPPPGGRH